MSIVCNLRRKSPIKSWCVFDFASKENQLSQLEKEIEAPDLWNNPSQAQQLMKQYNAVKTEVESWRNFSQRLHDALELSQLDDESLRAELETEISTIETELEKRSFTTMLSGKYDHDAAILLQHPQSEVFRPKI